MNLAVVGTDTGVGKTVVTAALVARLRAEGTDASAVKPAQTGFPEDDDADYVRWACGDEAAATRLRTFGEPLAPAVAARRADDPIAYESLLADTRDAMADAEVSVIEGAGGLRVPLSNDPRKEIVDLVSDLDVPALVVARSGLGTLNHTALTVEALRNRGVSVLGVVLNRYEGASVAERTNPDELERMCDCPVWTLPESKLETPEAVRKLADNLPPVHRQMGE
ncbi:dethiobiotin synthase [Natronomonas halophila]|uniref:dethiobiotin synthase n=1 Tax=Natronomonas halophila TaxID=2747817 RepID=UPI0015B4230D|nr:dethiobiotin synthase [Natronomonas halophila]QLD87191.1 dethiobiotin synthase [Natronomonas halophila]